MQCQGQPCFQPCVLIVWERGSWGKIRRKDGFEMGWWISWGQQPWLKWNRSRLRLEDHIEGPPVLRGQVKICMQKKKSHIAYNSNFNPASHDCNRYSPVGSALQPFGLHSWSPVGRAQPPALVPHCVSRTKYEFSEAAMQGSSASCFKQRSPMDRSAAFQQDRRTWSMPLGIPCWGRVSDLLSMQVRPIRPRFSLEDLITCLILLACSEVLTTRIDGSPPSSFGCLMIGSSNQWVLQYSSKLDRLSQCMLLAAEVDQGKKKLLSTEVPNKS